MQTKDRLTMQFLSLSVGLLNRCNYSQRRLHLSFMVGDDLLGPFTRRDSVRIHRRNVPSISPGTTRPAHRKKIPNVPIYVTQHPARSCFSHIVYRLHCNRRWVYIRFFYTKIPPFVQSGVSILFSLVRTKKKGMAPALRSMHRRESANILWIPRSRVYVDECHSAGFIDDICSKLRVAKLFNTRVRFHALCTVLRL